MMLNTFYEQFPEHDSDQCPDSETLFSQDDRDTFAQRVRKYLNNQRRGPVKSTVTTVKALKKTTTALSLFKSEHSERIIARRDIILQETPGMNKLNAYNKALELEWKEYQVTSPDQVKTLEAAAKSLRDESSAVIGEQLPEMQKR
ncbi:hypothetical protein BDV93DRAFT_515125 [Ceratobasidium sp. AG-I]|nr:hypothetical protein BDV93DRAFT_515125 [Ceratobasidium sp. AG-I]